MKKTPTDIHSHYPCNPPALEPMIEQLLSVRNDVLQKEVDHDGLSKVHPNNLKSARNLVQYMAFRTYDVRELQLDMTEWGLSSLGRAERKVQATLDTVLHTMHTLTGRKWAPKELPPICYRDARKQLEDNADRLLGDHPQGRRVRVMVTMPSEVGRNFTLVKNLLLNGMDCARINCAHDNVQVWKKMVTNISKAVQATGKPCKILMDLGGPKLRTGQVQSGPKVLKIRPKRNEMGLVEAPALVWLHTAGTPIPAEMADIPSLSLNADWLSQCQENDRIRLVDARGASRKLTICEATKHGCLATADKTIYFAPCLELRLKRKGVKLGNPTTIIGEDMPSNEGGILLKTGDLLLLSKQQLPGSSAQYDISRKIDKTCPYQHLNPQCVGRCAGRRASLVRRRQNRWHH
ncbi:MAG: hypothetical protein IPN76_33690 [Saprospiraceae bacterium]|nr:hypothetical protein [Saprospiraceae bacterium]